MAREVLRYPHPALKAVCTPVDPAQAGPVVGDLLETMRAHPGCVGLAAPQLGELVRVIVVDVSEHPKAETSHGLLTLVNPVVVGATGAHVAREGCLSIPHLTANVRRATEVAVEAFDPEGGPVRVESTGFEARCLLHEIDHLDGILFLDRVDSLSRDVFRRKRFGAAPEERPAGRVVLRAVSRLNRGLADGDLTPLAEVAMEDVEWHPPADLPDPGPFRGYQEVEGFLMGAAESWDELRIDVEAMLAADDRCAVARLRLSARGSGSGIQTSGLLIGAFWLRDGRISRVELGRDEAAALAATGLAG